MRTSVYIAIVTTLVVAIVVVGIVDLAYWNRNILTANSNILIPFNIPHDGVGTYAAMSCPVGSSINIVTAIAEVYDPAGMCTTTPNVNYLTGMCESSVASSYCSNNLPLNTAAPGISTVCGNNTTQCRTRDVTAIVGDKCNGLSNTVLNWDGIPYPCSITPSSTAYTTLPKYPGNSGYNPGSNGGTSVPSTSTQGYVLHGLYTCQPND